ncbi:tetraacyldisaccharide 4'-kinase [Celerinatantimonas yamalensis]|uniref:Tetraacyldisaccharide 4'-kinase n=1 Tax=Celerinatantimonas yamalensis TaxID=559956 RepID=A0ABW9G3A5_9GAMM
MLNTIWYRKGPLTWLLWPLSWLFSVIVRYRYRQYQQHPQRSYRSTLPVIIVGNIGIGGNGKTPVVLALCHYLRTQGYTPAVISRGYGGQAVGPLAVNDDMDTSLCGDEPLLIRRRTGCPVVICRRRPQAVEFVQKGYPECDVIIADDGMQHYQLARDIEICVVDAERQFGNCFCLPAGPLREPLSRLMSVDRIVANGGPIDHYDADVMALTPDDWRYVGSGQLVESVSMPSHGVALAGIGHPPRFYQTLRQMGIGIDECIEIGDHGRLTHEQIQKYHDQIVLMTEKDALKYSHQAGPKWYYLPVSAQLPDAFYSSILQQLERVYVA